MSRHVERGPPRRRNTRLAKEAPNVIPAPLSGVPACLTKSSSPTELRHPRRGCKKKRGLLREQRQPLPPLAAEAAQGDAHAAEDVAEDAEDAREVVAPTYRPKGHFLNERGMRNWKRYTPWSPP